MFVSERIGRLTPLLKKALLVNACLIAGFTITLLVAPGRTPIYALAVACIGVAAAVNFAILRRPIEVEGQVARRWRLFPVLILWIVFVLALLMHVYRWPIAF
jgi:hypothetical protein